MERERDTLYRTFERTVVSVARQSDAKNQALEKLLLDASDAFERKKAQFTEIVRSARLDPVVLQVPSHCFPPSVLASCMTGADAPRFVARTYCIAECHTQIG